MARARNKKQKPAVVFLTLLSLSGSGYGSHPVATVAPGSGASSPAPRCSTGKDYYTCAINWEQHFRYGTRVFDCSQGNYVDSCGVFHLCNDGCLEGWQGDNWCDAACNVPACNMDGGDCGGSGSGSSYAGSGSSYAGSGSSYGGYGSHRRLSGYGSHRRLGAPDKCSVQPFTVNGVAAGEKFLLEQQCIGDVDLAVAMDQTCSWFNDDPLVIAFQCLSDSAYCVAVKINDQCSGRDSRVIKRCWNGQVIESCEEDRLSTLPCGNPCADATRRAVATCLGMLLVPILIVLLFPLVKRLLKQPSSTPIKHEESTNAKIREFERTRMKAKQDGIWTVVVVGLVSLTTAFLLRGISLAGHEPILDTATMTKKNRRSLMEMNEILYVASSWFYNGGILAIASSDADLDALAKLHPKMSSIIVAAMFVWFAFCASGMAVAPEVLRMSAILPLLPVIYFLFGTHRALQQRRLSTVFCAVIVLANLGRAIDAIAGSSKLMDKTSINLDELASSDVSGRQSRFEKILSYNWPVSPIDLLHTHQALKVLDLLAVVVVLSQCGLWRRVWRTRRNSRAVFWAIMYSDLFFLGVKYVLFVVAVKLTLEMWQVGWLISAIPFIVLPPFVAANHKRVFRFLAKQFEREQRLNDGGFIAALLDAKHGSDVGDLFWIHIDEIALKNSNFSKDDHRHNFNAGEIVAVDQSRIVSEGKAPEKGFWVKPGRPATPAAASNAVMPILNDDEYENHPRPTHEDLVQHARQQPTADTTAGTTAGTTADTTDWVWVKDSTSGARATQLIELGESMLKCVDWEEEAIGMLFGTSPRAANESQADEQKRKQKKISELGRHCRPGEIDYFVSHSWHDDGIAKFEALKKVAHAFKRQKGRFPTFWIDAVCFDQKDISSGLKVLPVNIQACDTVLVLCGKTYCTRLWCIWELYTVFAFAPVEQAQARVQLQKLEGEHADVDVVAGLSQFKLDDAKCYDPNEQAKIMTIIRECGEGTFESHIRKLGCAVKGPGI